MKKLLPYALMFIVAAIALFVTNRPEATTPPPTVQMEVMDESLQGFANDWKAEVARRFPDAVVVLCHGGTFVEGQWLVKAQDYELPLMTTDQLAQHYKNLFPNRVLVLLCCNPGHLHLHVHGVYHAMDSVWCVPDRAVSKHPGESRMKLFPFPPLPVQHRDLEGGDRWASDPGVVGNIFEFVTD